MTRPAGKTGARDPWRALIAVAQIPDGGLHRDIEADPATRAAMAEVASVREILAARASFDVMPESGGRVHVTGRVQGLIGQICVVTLDPIENEIDEPVDLTFVPPEQVPQVVHSAEDVAGNETEIADAPEPIENGTVDLGRLATDVLYLAIDPYPRKPDAVFEPPAVAADPEDHPFALLKALRSDPGASVARKPKGKSKGT
jgi:uncharacterized metal-binding protein YceD (DUF177 family)